MTKVFEDLNSIREFNELDSFNRTYYKEFYLDTRKLKEQGVFEDHECAGIWKYYDKRGRLFKQIDFETGKKQLFDGRTEPFDALLLAASFSSLTINSLFLIVTTFRGAFKPSTGLVEGFDDWLPEAASWNN